MSDSTDSNTVEQAPAATPPEPSADAYQGGGSVARATVTCRESLAACCDIAWLRVEWAEDSLADYNLWAANVGASENESLLEGQIEHHIRRVLLDQLGLLKSAVDRCRRLGTSHFPRKRI